MGFFRKSIYALLTLLLLVSLTATAQTLGLKFTIGSTSKMESLLKESGFYKSFSDVLIEQAKSSSLEGGNDANFNSELVQKSASAALNEEFLEKNGSAFIKGNYDWLSGKTEKPQYTIDLGPAREEFAKNTGLALASRLATLPNCTNAQMAQLKALGDKIDPYTVECLPFTTNPDDAGQKATEDIQSNSSFLNNAVLTPDSLNPSEQSSSEPYYKKMENLPKFYQLLLKAPVIFGALALLLILCMLFIAPTKRRALRRISFMLVISGLFLIVSKAVLDIGFKQIEKGVNESAGDAAKLQESLINLMHGIEKSITSFNMYFGIGYAVAAIILFLIVKKGAGKPQLEPEHTLLKTTPEATSFVPPTENGIIPEAPKPAPSTPSMTSLSQEAPKKKRPPRLIQ